MKAAFSETRVLRPVMYDELDHSDGYIHEGEILFVNWESINKDNALMIRDSEQSKSLFRHLSLDKPRALYYNFVVIQLGAE